MIIEQMFLM
jgi:hypothetical protein